MGMREKYQSLALADLKEIAKSRGIKGTSGMKKADIIDAMVALDEKEEKEQTAAPKAETKEETAEKPRTAHETKKSREKAAEEKKTEPVKSAASGRKAGPCKGTGPFSACSCRGVSYGFPEPQYGSETGTQRHRNP